jgi:hypothetical protein
VILLSRAVSAFHIEQLGAADADAWPPSSVSSSERADDF